ncbi:hypothetical protein [Microbacterium sp.]
MTTYLTEQFIAAIRHEEHTFTLDERELTLRESSARAGMLKAELAVVEEGAVIGYITPYGANEHGAIAAHLFTGMPPRVFRELEPALREILSTQPRR